MDTDGKKSDLWCSTRLNIAIQILLGVMVMYLLRGNMGVALVCMTSPRNLENQNVNETCVTKLQDETEDGLQEQCKMEAEFDYDKTTQGYILGSFFLIHWLTPLPGGWLAGKYGGKIVLAWSVLICSILSLLTPLAARTHIGLLITTRVLMGGIQGGGLWSATEVILSKWAPPLERTILAGISVLGHCFGNMLGLPLSAILCTYGFDSGWPISFYIFGATGVCWFIMWMTTAYESPTTHPRISENERQYIVDSLQKVINVSEKVTNIPYLSILRSMPVWAFVVAIGSFDWGMYTFLFNIPSYMKEILQFNILKSGMIAAVPFIGYTIVTMISIYLPDFIRRKQFINTTNVRKLFHSLGTFLPAIFLILAVQFDGSSTLVVVWLFFGLAISGCVAGGVASANPLDFAGRFAGAVMGVAMLMEAFVGMVAELIIGYVTVDGTREQWHIIFYITSCVYVFGGIFFILFASGELQTWAAIKDIDYTVEQDIGQNKNIDNSCNQSNVI